MDRSVPREPAEVRLRTRNRSSADQAPRSTGTLSPLPLSIYISVILIATALLLPAWAGAADGKAPQGRNFDARVQANQTHFVQPGNDQLQAIQDLRATLPDAAITFDATTGATRTLYNQAGYLTHSLPGDAKGAALAYVSDHLDLFGLTQADLAGHRVQDSVYSRVSGATHLYLTQRHRGLDVYNGLLHVNVNRDGRIISVNNGFVPELAAAAVNTRPAIDAAAAVSRVGDHLGIALEALPQTLSVDRGVEQTTRLTAPGLSREAVEAKLVWLPVRRGEVRLAWNLQIHTLDEEHSYDLTVDAETGQVWTRFDWTNGDSYRVYPQPVESPNHTTPLPPSDGRILVTNPADATASPNGWHSTGASSFTNMRGNNVHAYDDRNNTNSPPGSEPSCGASLNCDFPIDLNQAPLNYIPAAVANLFYWNNVIHDVQHQYGFDEPGGNFQVNTFGRGGAGNDDVRAEAQDGGGTNNANFSTPPDGSRPRMQMFIWTAPNPDKDGDLDNGIVIHEYGHGISIRQVGGPANSGCLNNNQQPGEGWSDWLALSYTAEAGDAGTDPRGIGTYALNQPTSGAGIRTQRYSTNPAINSHTYASIGGMAIPHGIGEVWAQGIWEVYWALVNQHGFSTDLYNAAGGFGNQRAMLYVNEGLKNTACSPTFINARDGIIQAATDNFAGEDVCLLWDAFAAFGLGTDASTGGSNSTTATNGFSVPAACQGPPPPSNCPAGSIDFNSLALTAYSNQNVSNITSVLDGGDTLQLTGNTWVRSTQTFAVTADTVIDFEFASGSQGEIHAIGFDENDTLNDLPRLFQFWGTQNWTGAGRIDLTPKYSGGGAFQSYSVPVGQSYTGTMFLVFANDKDSGTLNNESQFRCVRIFENAPPPPPPPSSCPAGSIDFNTFTTEAYSNQDGTGSVTVEDGGDTLFLVGNRWRRSTQSFNVTANTVVELEYQSGSQGEIHGIGFDENQTLTDDLRIFQYWGTQNWTGANQFTPPYSGSGAFETFTIPVGQSYTGAAMRLVFTNDKDSGTLDNEGRFRCVRVFEDAPPPPPPGGCTVDDDFEAGAADWFNDAASTCTTGAYVLGNPTLQTSGGVTTQIGGSNSGVNSIFTATNTSAGSADVDGGNCILGSPTWSVANTSTLSVAYWHGQRDAGDDPSGDFFRLEVSTNGGASWSAFASNGDTTSNASWSTATAAIPAGSSVQVRMQCSDGAGPGDIIECGMDDLSICDN